MFKGAGLKRTSDLFLLYFTISPRNYNPIIIVLPSG